MYSDLPLLSEIEDFFKTLDPYPDKIVFPEMTLTSGKINQFVRAEIILLKANSQNKGYLPYYLRLLKIMNKVKEIQNLNTK